MAPKNSETDLLNAVDSVGMEGRIPIPISGTRMFFGLPDPDPLVRGTDPDRSLFS
jgi:hypothetical protein